jgi:hypothetical protein
MSTLEKYKVNSALLSSLGVFLSISPFRSLFRLLLSLRKVPDGKVGRDKVLALLEGAVIE